VRKQLIIMLCYVAVIFLSVLIFPGVEFRSLSAIVGMGILLWLVNLIIKPLLLVITLPLNIITFGLMSLFVNTWTIRIADRLAKGFSYPNFGTAFVTALILMAVHLVLIDNKESVLMKKLS
jgi:putative membrane protein